MAIGKARPDQPEMHVIDDVVTPAFGRPQDIARREVLEPEAKSAATIAGEDQVIPTGGEIHQKAREKASETAAPEVQKPQPKKFTGEEITREVLQEKKQQQDNQSKVTREREAEVRKVKEQEQKDRDDAAKKQAQEADKAREQAAKSFQLTPDKK